MEWSEVQYVESAVADKRVDTYLETLRALYVDGRVLFRCFQPKDAPVFQNACRHDLSGLDSFITAFLSASSVQTIVDELQLTLMVKNPLNYHYYTTGLLMEGALAVQLLKGGHTRSLPAQKKTRGG